MTVVACTGSAGIMNPGTTRKGCRGMTGIAIQSGYKVRRVGLGILADRCTTIMAGFAIVNDAGMVKHRSNEGAGVMA